MSHKYNSLDKLLEQWAHERRINNKKWYYTIYPFYKKQLAAALPWWLTEKLERRVAFKGTFRFNMRYRFTHPWTIIQDLKYETKAFFQRGFYGFSSGDADNFHIYLAEIMPHVVKKMTGEYNYSVCYEAIKEAAEKLDFDPDAAWGWDEDKLSKEDNALVMALAIDIENSWYDEIGAAFQRYYDIMCGSHSYSFEEEQEIIHKCKQSLHMMIDKFEHLST